MKRNKKQEAYFKYQKNLLIIKLSYFDIKNYKINNDFSVDILENFNLTKQITSFEELGFRINIVDGSFGCPSNRLTTLKGGPKIVTGDYSVIHNNLKTIDDDFIVGGTLYVGDNQITNLSYDSLDYLKKRDGLIMKPSYL